MDDQALLIHKAVNEMRAHNVPSFRWQHETVSEWRSSVSKIEERGLWGCARGATTLINESKASVMTTIRRMHLIVDSMCRDALSSLKDQNADLVRTVFPR